MIQRRQFLGSVASFTAIASIARFGFAGTATPMAETNLNWKSRVIDTVPHTHEERRPVVTGVSMQSSGPLLAIVGDDHYVCLYNLEEERFTEHLKEHTDWIRAAKFSPNGKQLVTCGNDRRIVFWNTDDFSRPVRNRRQSEAIFNLAFSPDGTKVAAVGFDKKVRILDARDGNKIGETKCSCSDIHAVAFSHDNQQIAAGGRDGKIAIWNANTLEQTASFKAHKRRIRSIEFTPTGEIVSAAEDQIVRLTNATTTTIFRQFPRQSAKLFASVVMDNDLLATSGSDNKIRIWNSNTTSEIGMLAGHTGTVSSLAVSKDLLISGSYDTTVRVWQREQDASASATVVPANRRQSSNPGGWNRRLK